jgi:hypothetical protein
LKKNGRTKVKISNKFLKNTLFYIIFIAILQTNLYFILFISIMADLKPYFTLVEDVIKELGVDPITCRSEEEGQWNLQKGNLPVWIDVFYDETNKESYIQVMSPITEIPTTNREAFLEEVLDIAHDLFGVAFTKYENWLYVKSIRELEGLDKSEFRATMQRIGSYSEDYEAHFKKYFGGKAPDEAGN